MAAPVCRVIDGPFHLIGRSQQNFSFALEKRSGHTAGDVLGEADDAVIERNMEVGAVDGKLTCAINP